MPPIYCYYISAGDEENFQIKQSWVEGLPKVRGRYCCPTVETYDAFASVCKSGCNDKQLMQKIIVDVYLPLYPNCHKVVKRNNNGKLLAGPVFLNNDSGKGRIVTSFSCLDFRKRMQDTLPWTTKQHILHARARSIISRVQSQNQIQKERNIQ